jgi:polysaccharide export outer membrane protein
MKASGLIAALAFLAACGTTDDRRPTSTSKPPTGIEPGPPFLSVPPPQDPIALPKLPPPAPMTLVPGDLLHITVFRQKDLELEVRVPESGAIAYPLIGDVKTGGRTSKEVEVEIKRRLEEKYLHKAGVTLTIVSYAPRMVYVLGGVQKPGSFEYAPNRRLTVLQLISSAGGYSDRAYKEFVQLVRRKENGDREMIKFSIADVEKAVAKGQVEADLEVGPDDLLVIPSAARVVYVLGQVNMPKNIDMPSDSKLTVSMAISQAGSWTKFAAIGRIQVLRQPPGGDPVRLTVDLDAVISGTLEKDLELLPGDVVWVPQRSIF